MVYPLDHWVLNTAIQFQWNLNETEIQIFLSIFLIYPISVFIFRQLPVYTKTANGATAIPMPATVLVTRRCPPDKVRPLPPTPNHQSCKLWAQFIFRPLFFLSFLTNHFHSATAIPLTKSGSPSNESSRPNSPPDNNTPKNGIR